MTVCEEISARRRKQIAKGYDAAHDDRHTDGSLLDAAMSCLSVNHPSPWQDWYPPADGRTALIDAASVAAGSWSKQPPRGGRPRPSPTPAR